MPIHPLKTTEKIRTSYLNYLKTIKPFQDESLRKEFARAIEEKEFRRVGGTATIHVDLQVIAASNRNIKEMIEKGEFREDLYYRLNTVPIFVPPLRNRQEDIYLLFRKFANDFAEKYRMPAIKLTEDAVHILNSYRWPGNIRQLKNITEQISIIDQARKLVIALEETKAEDIVLIDIKDIAVFTDYFVICSATSDRMINALIRSAEETMSSSFKNKGRVMGSPSNGWVLIDFSDIVKMRNHDSC